jgi:transposase InsO family protein
LGVKEWPNVVEESLDSATKLEAEETIRRDKPRCSGIYTQGEVQGLEVTFTLDTGASKTIMSMETYRRIPQSRRPILNTSHGITMFAADGRQMPYYGEAVFQISMGPVNMEKVMGVVELSDEVLVGADLLLGDKDGPADLMLSRSQMIFRGAEIPLEQVRRTHKVKKLKAAETITIPGMSEILVDVYIDGYQRSGGGTDEFFIEGSREVTEHNRLLLAPALVTIRGPANAKARIMNPFKKARHLYQDQTVGFASGFKEVCDTLVLEEEASEVDNLGTVRRIKLGNDPEMTRRTPSVEKGGPTVPEYLEPLFKDTVEGRPEEEARVIAEMLSRYKGAFSQDDTDLGRTSLVEHCIDTGNARPIKQAPRRIPMAFKGEDEAAIQKLLDQGSIRPSTSPWASPIVLVRKKDGSVRPCVDYRRLNAVTKIDAIGLPRCSECLDAMAGAKLFSTLDITSAYNQVPVRPQDIPKTAFVTKQGLFEFVTTPFGMVNSGATWTRCIELALQGLAWTTCVIYLDDIIIFGKDFEEHIERLREVLGRIEQADLKLKPRKCSLLKKSVGFLGHVVSAEGILPNKANIEKILSWSTPKTVTDVRAVLGLGSYYRRHIRDYSKKMLPLIELTKKNKKFEWTPECQAALDNLKAELTGPEIMAYPEESGLMILDTDASAYSIGAVLSQVQGGQERVIAYGSRTLNKAEINYCVTNRELLAVKHFVEYYRHYLLGKHFLVRSDHQALKWLFSLREPKNRIARWLEILSEYDFAIEYRPGKKHQNGDAMSRIRCKNPRNCGCDSDDTLECGPCHKCEKWSEDMESSLPRSGTAIRRLYESDWRSIPRLFYHYLWYALTLLTLTSSHFDMTEGSAQDLEVGTLHFPCFYNFLSIGNSVPFEGQTPHPANATCDPWERWNGFPGVEEEFQDDGRTRPKLEVSDSLQRRSSKLVKSTQPTEATVLAVQTRSRPMWGVGQSVSELRKLQLSDKEIGPVLKWVESEKRPFGPEVCSASPAVRHYWNCWDSLAIKQGILYRKFRKRDNSGEYLQFLVPSTLRQSVLQQMHDCLLSGHLGKKKTREKVLQRYYWYQVRDDVNTWIDRCDVCGAVKKPPKKPKAKLGEMPTGAPLDRLCTDFLGPLPETERGNKHIMVVTDHFTRWVEIFPLPDQTAVTTAEVLLDQVISRYGCPYDIHSDQGRNYESKIFADLVKLLEVRKTRTTPGNPRCNGQAERFNRTMMDMVRAYLKGQQREWDKFLGCLAGAYRATVNEATGFTPNRLMLGREVRLPAEIIYGPPPAEDGATTSYVEYVELLKERLQTAHEVAREHLKKYAQRQKADYDAKTSTNTFERGDLVWYLSDLQQHHITPNS